MTNDGKENIRHVTCSNHAARSDREFSRLCPSKLSKRELEDLYFSLLENNTQLKKTINGQRDQIKVLTTKVHRMTIQKNTIGNQNKECCASSKAILSEQKESIENLKKANERLSDRIRILNMRLCSAKQFLKRSSAQSTNRCVKCCLTPNASVKNASMIALNTKASDANLRTDAGSSQFLNKETSTIKTIEMDSTEMKDESCQQNKCQNLMDELKQKVGNLEEELSKTHEQYSERMRKLEEEIKELHSENSRVRALQKESEQRLEIGEKKTGELLQKLRNTEVQCDDLTTELQIEKSKVSELETQVKSAAISNKVADAVEKHLMTAMTNRTSDMIRNKTEPTTLGLCASDWNYRSPVASNKSETSRFATEPEKESVVIKNSDDSGYAEKFEDKKESQGTDQNISDQIASLQMQLDNLKLSMTDSDNMRERNKSVAVNSLEKSKSDSNEMCRVVGARSSLSYDIFQPSRVKAIDNMDQYPSTSRGSGVLVSLEDINKSPGTDSANYLQQIDRHGKFQVSSPLSVDAARIPSFGEQSKKSNISNSPKQSEKNVISDSGFDKPSNQNCDLVLQGNANKRIDSLNEYNTNANHKLEEAYNGNGYEKKRRRSSLRSYNQNKLKDLSVSYDQNETQVGPTINIVDISTETPPNNICAPFQEDTLEVKVSEKNLKKLHYEKENPDNTPIVNQEQYIDKKAYEIDKDSKKKTEENNETPSVKDILDNINSGVQYLQNIGPLDKNVQLPGNSTGNSTYTVEDKPSRCKLTGDAHAGNENIDATYQVQNGDDQNHLEICEGHARICTCPRIPHRDVSVFRTCSGTLRFKTTTSTKNKFRQCHCVRNSKTDAHVNGCPEVVAAKSNGMTPKQCGIPQPVHTSTPDHQKIYNAEGSAEVMRSTSPDNTDHEISSLTDLPNEDKSPRDYISPGEEKATSTFTESYAAATITDYGSLSLGEVPAIGAKKLSDLEMKDKTPNFIAMSATSNKMEEALRIISEELTRCRELLQGQLPAQVPTIKQKPQLQNTSSMTEDLPIELRRSEGSSRIGGASTPKCIFTIHVGTVVLSDQAVLCARGKSLALTWRFYNQTASMTRLLAGRVMNFDFSTEYDLKITDHFLHYMKLEELPIIICEMEKQEEAFASCALPLRDALLHTNRRVDMSLALVAGLQLLRQQSLNEIDSSEEVGVLDVWCILRVEPSALAAIYSTIAKTASPQTSSYKNQHHSSLMEQMLDDEQSVDYRYSQDKERKPQKTSKHPNTKDELKLESNPSFSNIKSAKEIRREKKSSDSTSLYDILKSKKWSRRRSTPIKEARHEGSRHKSVSYDPKLPKDPTHNGAASIEHRDDSQDVLSTDDTLQSITITVLWLALNEDCKAMTDPTVKRLYVAYSFMGQSGADLETPTSLAKPKHYMDKLHFMFRKTFTLNDCDLPLLGHLARCRQPPASATSEHDPKHCVVFTVVSEPPEDPLGLDSCEDVGFAYLYLGDVLEYSAGADQYTAVVAVHTAGQEKAVCGALAIKVDGLRVLRRCIAHSYSERSFEIC